MRHRLGTALVLTTVLLAAPGAGRASDHLDDPPTGRYDADIGALYVFAGQDFQTHTVLAMTVSPAAGAIGPTTFGTDVIYQFNVVDYPASGQFDITADIAFRVTFGPPDAHGDQSFELYKSTGAAADGHSTIPTDLILSGVTNQVVDIPTGGQFLAGLRSDPFFFDYAGFLGSIDGRSNGRGFNDGGEVDFFADLDVLAVVIELPDSQLPAQSVAPSFEFLGAWASTAIADNGGYDQVDRVGRPLINTIVNSTGPIVNAPAANKALFNAAHPRDDAQFKQEVEDALAALSALDSGGTFDATALGVYTSVLLPDVLPFNKADTSSSAVAGLFNGARLEDDVVDILFNVFTGGDPLDFLTNRDHLGAITTDGIGPHSNYGALFPYLGPPTGSPHFTSVPQQRLEDTRPTGKTGDGTTGAAPFVFDVRDRAGLPTTGIDAVSLNVTIDRGEQPPIGGGYATVYACDRPRPTASNLNFHDHLPVPNAVITPVAADGTVCIFVYGTADLLVDINGYFAA